MCVLAFTRPSCIAIQLKMIRVLGKKFTLLQLIMPAPVDVDHAGSRVTACKAYIFAAPFPTRTREDTVHNGLILAPVVTGAISSKYGTEYRQ